MSEETSPESNDELTVEPAIEPISLEEAIRQSFPDASPGIQVEIVAILGQRASYYDAAIKERDSNMAAVARLMLYRKGGATSMYPPAYENALFESLQRLERSRGGNGPAEDEPRALVDAIATCSEQDRPLKAWLNSELAQLLLVQQTAGTQHHPEFSSPWSFASAAAEIAIDLGRFTRPEFQEILQTAVECALAYAGPDRFKVIEDACRYAQQCVNIALDEPSDPREVALTRNNFAQLLIEANDIEALTEARQLLLLALIAYEEHLGRDHGLVASTVGSLLAVMRELAIRGDTDLLEESIQLGERYWPSDNVAAEMDPRLLAPLAGHLGSAYRLRLSGDGTANIDRAIKLGERALELSELGFGRYSANTIGALSNLAGTYHLAVEKRNRDRMGRAQEIVMEAVARAEHAGLNEDPLQKVNLLGSLANIMADRAQTAAELHAAIRIQRDLVSSLALIPTCPPRLRYDTRNNLALSLQALHDRESSESAGLAALDEATAIFSDLRSELLRDGGYEQHLTTASIELVAAKLTRARLTGDAFRSDPETLVLLDETADLLEKAKDPQRVLNGARVLGYLLAALGDDEYAATFYGLSAAAATSWYASAVSVETRTNTVVDAGNVAIEAAWHFARTSQIERSFRVLDDAKVRWLHQRFDLDQAAIIDLKAVDSDLATAFADAIRQVELVEQLELQFPSSLGARNAWPPATDSDMERVEIAQQANQALTAIVAQIRMAHPDFLAYSSGQPTPVDVPVAHIAVAHHGTLAIVIWPDGSFTHIEDSSVSHDDLVTILHQCDVPRQLGDHRLLATMWEQKLGILSSLVEQLTLHLRTHGFESVVLVPSGGLATAPVHRIGAGALDDAFAVSIAPAHWLLADRQPLASHEKSTTPPTYFGVAETEALRYAAAEVAGSAAFFPQSAWLPASDVTGAEVKQALSRSSFLHIACHGSYSELNPGESNLKLRRPLKLTDLVHGIRGRNGCIAVVAACESAATHRLADEGISFSTLTHFAGASSVLGCLWEVDDLLCSIVVTRFFSAISSGQSPAEALRTTKTWVTAASPATLAAWLEGTLRALNAQSPSHRHIQDVIDRMRVDGSDTVYFTADVLPFVIIGHP